MNKRLSTLTTLIVWLILCGSTMETHAKVVGYWSFNHNQKHVGTDSSPNHNHGELKGRDTAKWVQDGKVGGALQLDGGDGLEVPHDESLNLKDQLTLMCWVKFADLNDFASAQRWRQQSLIWKSAPESQVSYGLYVNRGQLELDLPLYANNPGLLFSWLYVIDPKCRGQFINGIPDFPARCQRKFAFGLGDSQFGNLGFRASMPGPIAAHAVHPTFFVNFFPSDNPRLDEEEQDFLKEREQDFIDILSHFMIGTSNIYLPRIMRHFENLDKIWFHFAVVADGHSIRLYVNGREKVSERQGSDRQPEPFINSQEPLTIGTGLDGIIDEVMILDHALTENEIKEAMELGNIGISLERFLLDSQGVSVVTPNSPQIYWTDGDTGRIQRTNHNGANVEDLVTGLIFPDEIALDEASSKMYWATNLGNDRVDKIQCANINGTNIEKLVTTTRNSGDGMALDMVDGKIYWVSSVIDKIQCANIDGTNVQTLELKQVQQWLIENLALDVAGGKIYWTAFMGGIQRANLDGTNAEKLVANTVPDDIALDVAGGKMYWTVRGKIQRANLDGTSVEDLVLMDRLLSKSIALDVVGGKMYWANTDMGKIQRANLDGTNVEDVVTGLSRPTGIALALSSAPKHESFGVEAQDKLLIQLGDSLTEEIDPGNDVDYFSIEVTETGQLSVYTVGSLDTVGTLQNSEGTTLAANDDGDDLNFRIVYDVEPGTYYIKVESYELETGSYTIYAAFSARLPADVNGDGVVNVTDLIIVATNFGVSDATFAQGDANEDGTVDREDILIVLEALEAQDTAGAPHATATTESLQRYIDAVKRLNRTDAAFQKGIAMLEELVATWGEAETVPEQTALLANYPNPFNPETWIPYQLAAPTDVSLSIYAADGKLVRRLDLGHQGGGMYESRSRAAYWDGRNALGEPIASGVYFYTLTAGEFTATRKMLIRK